MGDAVEHASSGAVGRHVGLADADEQTVEHAAPVHAASDSWRAVARRSSSS
jgi:hypothetical protein